MLKEAIKKADALDDEIMGSRLRWQLCYIVLLGGKGTSFQVSKIFSIVQKVSASLHASVAVRPPYSGRAILFKTQGVPRWHCLHRCRLLIFLTIGCLLQTQFWILLSLCATSDRLLQPLTKPQAGASPLSIWQMRSSTGAA